MTIKQLNHDGPIVKIDVARMEGARLYFTGKPCKRGHVDQRFTTNRTCKSCSLVNQREDRASNIEAYRSRDRARHAANKEAMNIKCRKWRESNKEKQAEINRNWALRNRDKVKASKKKNRLDNPESYKSYTLNRRARIKSAKGKIFKSDIIAVIENQKNRCAEPSCRADLKSGYHIDHIMPFALGGEHSLNNIQALCPSCNLRKSAKHPADWAKENGRLI